MSTGSREAATGRGLGRSSVASRSSTGASFRSHRGSLSRMLGIFGHGSSREPVGKCSGEGRDHPSSPDHRQHAGPAMPADPTSLVWSRSSRCARRCAWRSVRSTSKSAPHEHVRPGAADAEQQRDRSTPLRRLLRRRRPAEPAIVFGFAASSPYKERRPHLPRSVTGVRCASTPASGSAQHDAPRDRRRPESGVHSLSPASRRRAMRRAGCTRRSGSNSSVSNVRWAGVQRWLDVASRYRCSDRSRPTSPALRPRASRRLFLARMSIRRRPFVVEVSASPPATRRTRPSARTRDRRPPWPSI